MCRYGPLVLRTYGGSLTKSMQMNHLSTNHALQEFKPMQIICSQERDNSRRTFSGPRSRASSQCSAVSLMRLQVLGLGYSHKVRVGATLGTERNDSVGAPVSHKSQLYSFPTYAHHHHLILSSLHRFPHRFPIIVRPLDHRRKTTVNELKIFPLSQPLIPRPSSRLLSLPSHLWTVMISSIREGAAPSL
jgi:hypothetical protein